jgi:hypothetical protein
LSNVGIVGLLVGLLMVGLGLRLGSLLGIATEALGALGWGWGWLRYLTASLSFSAAIRAEEARAGAGGARGFSALWLRNLRARRSFSAESFASLRFIETTPPVR